MLYYVDQLFFVVYSLSIPVIMVAVRDQIRRSRLKITSEIEDYVGSEFPSLKAVRKKYDTEQSKAGVLTDMRRKETRALLACALLYSSVTAFGWALVAFGGASTVACPNHFLSTCSVFWNASAAFSSTELDAVAVRQSLAIAAYAFLGAFVFSLKSLIRALMNYELTPLALIRCTAQVIFGTVIAQVIWHGSVSLFPDVVGLEQSWLVVAFFVGFVPEYALNAVGRKIDLSLVGLGARRIPSDRTGAVPLEILDGIDIWTRFRLEEARIYDVQNLATYDAIELYVDSPYGFFEIIDWIMQAQLCVGVGPDAFLDLREVHVRTIFDLERGVFDPECDQKILEAIGRVILPKSKAPSVSEIRHAARIILDDIHVHRIRQIWNLVRCHLGIEHEWLKFRTRPGETDCEAARAKDQVTMTDGDAA
jgi:hypothetical protein